MCSNTHGSKKTKNIARAQNRTLKMEKCFLREPKKYISLCTLSIHFKVKQRLLYVSALTIDDVESYINLHMIICVLKMTSGHFISRLACNSLLGSIYIFKLTCVHVSFACFSWLTCVYVYRLGVLIVVVAVVFIVLRYMFTHFDYRYFAMFFPLPLLASLGVYRTLVDVCFSLVGVLCAVVFFFSFFKTRSFGLRRTLFNSFNIKHSRF